jgi:hypothetical protein
MRRRGVLGGAIVAGLMAYALGAWSAGVKASAPAPWAEESLTGITAAGLAFELRVSPIPSPDSRKIANLQPGTLARLLSA